MPGRFLQQRQVPACRRSKQPFVKTTRSPDERHCVSRSLSSPRDTILPGSSRVQTREAARRAARWRCRPCRRRRRRPDWRVAPLLAARRPRRGRAPHGRDRIPGPGDVRDLSGHRGHQLGPVASHHDQAVGSAGHHEMVELEAVEERAAQLGDPAGLDGVRGTAEPPGELSSVRGEHGRAAVAIEVAALGIDDDRDAPVPAPGDGGAKDRRSESIPSRSRSGRACPAAAPGRVGRARRRASRARERVGLLPVQSQDLLLPRDDAKLPRRRAVAARTTSVVPIPASAQSATSCSPAASSPTTVARSTTAPRVATFSATFAAPPGRAVVPVTRTTGTGASGQIRSASPSDVLVEHGVADDEDAKTGQPLDQRRHRHR